MTGEPQNLSRRLLGRARRFAKVLDGYGEDTAECNLVDLLADALNGCRWSGTAFERALGLAHRRCASATPTTEEGA